MPEILTPVPDVEKEEADKIELRSEEVQEILSQPPAWIIRWGITLIFFIIVNLLLGSYFISYPDTVPAVITIITETPPNSVYARNAGNVTFFIKDQEDVKENDILGVISNPANSGEVIALLEGLDEYRNMLFLQPEYDTSIVFDSRLDLGSNQNAYLNLLDAHLNYVSFQRYGLYAKQLAAYRDQINYYRELLAQSQQQKNLLSDELEESYQRYLADSLLYENKAITRFDFGTSKSNYSAVRRSLETTKSNITNSRIQIAQLESTMSETEIAYRQEEQGLRNQLKNAFKNLETQLRVWEQNFLLRATIDGKAAFVKYWSDKQYVMQGDEVITIIPDSEEIFGRMMMPVAGSGKVDTAQTVNIRLANYPSNEYGMLIGEVESISLVPNDDNNYLIRVRLPNGLTSTYNKELPFRQEMTGNAEIITEDLRLIERFFNDIREVFDK